MADEITQSENASAARNSLSILLFRERQRFHYVPLWINQELGLVADDNDFPGDPDREVIRVYYDRITKDWMKAYRLENCHVVLMTRQTLAVPKKHARSEAKRLALALLKNSQPGAR